MDNHKDFFMHFPSMSRNGQVATDVVMDKLSSSESKWHTHAIDEILETKSKIQISNYGIDLNK